MSKQKRKDPKRNSKNEMKCMQNDSTRRSTFSKRGETMVLMVNDVFSLGFALTSDSCYVNGKYFFCLG